MSRRWLSAVTATVAVLSLATTAATVDSQSPPSVARGRAEGAAAPGAPRLLVIVAVDQFRADYLETYGAQWTRGLHDLLTNGAVFTNAAMPYAITRTCTGHASIGTGRLPSVHGMIDNEWYDRATRNFVSCTEDPTVSSVSLGSVAGSERHSPKSLKATTLADELRRQASRPPSIVSLALKARAAIGLGGHPGPNTTVLWEEDSGIWATSTAYTSAPPPVASAFVRAHPLAGFRGQVWDRALPLESYLFSDRAPGEPAGGVFPHRLSPALGVPLSAVWDASPFADAFVGDLAGTLVDQLPLGSGAATTDLLAIGFSALDYVGHNYGPRSHEVQDLLARLDVTLGSLLAVLDRKVGRDHYVLALTSDHGVAPLPEQPPAGNTAGRLNFNDVGRAVETALSVEFGRRRFIEAISVPYIYFLPGVLDQIMANRRAVLGVERAIKAVDGVGAAYWSSDLEDNSPTVDATLIGLRRSYVPGRSGDVAIMPRPFWVPTSAGTTHGSMHEYDTRVPLIFLGSRVRPGRYSVPSSPLDVAPTLAALANVRLPASDGRVRPEIASR